MFVLPLLVLCLSLAGRWRVEATSLALYNDTACSASGVIENVAALDGYPDGQCTHLTDLQGGDTFQGFKFLTLDDGCASTSPEGVPSQKNLLTSLRPHSVTLYGPDSVVCSGFVFAASLNVCYNTSWTYYSVDGCSVPSISSSTPTSTSTSSSVTVTASTSSSGKTPSLSGGALAGVIVVAIVAAAAIAVAAIFFLGRRTRRLDRERAAREAAETEPKPPQSVQGDSPRQYGSLGLTPVTQQAGVHQPVYEAYGQLPVSEMPGHALGELPAKP